MMLVKLSSGVTYLSNTGIEDSVLHEIKVCFFFIAASKIPSSIVKPKQGYV